jgi:phosphate transport system permease protein
MSATAEAARPLGIQAASPGQKLAEQLFKAGMLSCLGLSVLLLALLFIDIFTKGIPGLSLHLLTDYASNQPDQAGLRSAILGTVWLMAVCAFFIVPVGVATAVYLEEYANPRSWFNKYIEVNVQNLAAVPSIVYGILGLAFLVRGPISFGPVVIAGGLTLGLLVLPVVIITAREAIRAVPSSISEGSMALGATKWQTIWRQVLPASIPGVATGVILALSRAVGETAPLIMVGAVAFAAFDPGGLFDRFTALPIQIFNWIKSPLDEFQALAASAIMVLLVILVVMNSAAIYLRNRYEQKW